MTADLRTEPRGGNTTWLREALEGGRDIDSEGRLFSCRDTTPSGNALAGNTVNYRTQW